MRVWAENGMTVVLPMSNFGSASPKSPLPRAMIERPSGVSSARLEASAAAGKVLGRDAGHWHELGRHAIAERDRAGLVEQQRVDVARRLDRAAGSRDDVEADQPVHAGDADGRQKPADRRRNQTDEQRDQDGRRQVDAANISRSATR